MEYKREAYAAFDQLLGDIQRDIANIILGVRLQKQPVKPAAPRATQYSGASGGSAGSVRPAIKHKDKVGRNDPCPCGSGKKFKNCCMLEGLSPEEAAAKAKTAGRPAASRPTKR
ncbi:MAG: hypothetical protein GX557_13965 [Chloroflexi bacterium]|nr:hypothetical protein [Chloroflexota bacterium]